MKLVRDNIPGMHARGELGPHPDKPHRERQSFRKATPEEYRLLLRTKLAEEVGEVLSAVFQEHRLEELADVYEVLVSLIHAEGWMLRDVEQQAEKKSQRYGSLCEGWVLEEKK